jgi:DNA mismatch repair protein MSH5
MAIDQQKGTIGCAYYITREETLYFLQDLTSGNLDAVETCE